jgi:hypothetical protein
MSCTTYSDAETPTDSAKRLTASSFDGGRWALMFPTFFSLRCMVIDMDVSSGLPLERVGGWPRANRAIGRAQECPIDIGAQILATHCASGCFLYVWAAFSWDAGSAPLLNSLISVDTKHLTGGLQPTNNLYCSVQMICLIAHSARRLAQDFLAMQDILAMTQEIIVVIIHV